MKRFLATLLVAVMLLSVLPATSLAATQYATVIGGWLRLRAGASFNADIITSYYTGTVIEILGKSGSWYQVKTPDGRTGYMYSDYLTLHSGSGSAATNAYVTSHNGYGVRLRTGPGTGYRVIRTYPVGTPVTILESGLSWSRIQIYGTVGYMMTQFLTTNMGSGSGETVVCYATVWSGNGYGVNLRTGPGKQYSRIGKYSVGTSVAVLQKGAVWDRIRVGSRVGWMMNEFLHYYSTNQVTSVTLNKTNPVVGDVLSVLAMTPSNATVSYSWLVGGVQKATTSTYTVTSADVGKSIQLKITGTGNYTGTATSAATANVLSNTQITSVKLSTKVPVVGDVLSATVEPAGATVLYAWRMDGIQVSNAATYAVPESAVGKKIELIVTGTGAFSGMLSSGETEAVLSNRIVNGVTIINETNTTAGAAPTVGDKLTAKPSPAQATVSYQWMRNGAAIAGATSQSYTATNADIGAKLSVMVTGIGNYTGAATSTQTAEVVAAPIKPIINDITLPQGTVGVAYPGATLTATGGGTITWALANGSSLPAGLALSANGVISGTPTAAVSGATFSVIATNSAGASDAKSFTITIAPAAEVSVSLSPTTATLSPGGSQQFTATVNNASDTSVAWTMSGYSSASTTLASGLLTLGTDETGPITVRATSNADPTKYAEATVTVTAAPEVSVSIDPASASVNKGATQNFTATVNNASDTSVAWTMSGQLSTATTLNNGLLTVGADETAATITVRATSNADPNKYAEATVTVTTASEVSVSIDPASASVNKGATQNFTATVSNASDTSVAWTMSGQLSPSTTLSNGLLTVGADETAATITVRATSNADPTKYAEATVTVTDPASPDISITVDPTNIALVAGQTQQFTASILNDVTGSGYTWSVSGGNGATGIDTNGLLSVDALETASSLTVTVTANADPSKFASATVTVSPAMPISISIDPASATVVKGQTQQFTASILNDVTGSGYTWSVSGGNGATGIDTNGLLSVDALETASSLTVTVTSNADPSKFASANVTLEAPLAPISIAIRYDGDLQVSAGAGKLFTADIQNDPSGSGCVWSVANADGMTQLNEKTYMDSNGTLYVSAEETAQQLIVTATANADSGKTSSVTIDVLTIEVEITTAPSEVKAGEQIQFEARAKNDTANGGIRWEVMDSIGDASSIDTNGLLDVGAGETAQTLTIRATSKTNPLIYKEATITVLPTNQP